MNKYCVFLLLLAGLLLTPFHLQANLALSEYRLYFDNKSKNNSLLIRNTSDIPLEFTTRIIHMDMTEEGTLAIVEPNVVEGRSAKKLLRYSPRRGLIPAKGMQAIRLSLRKPANLDRGEYRAVLRVVGGTVSSELTSGGVAIKPKIAYNIPIIVRHGKLSAAGELVNPQLVMQNGLPSIQLWQQLDGNRSLYGDFVLLAEDNQEVGRVNNVALYPPLTRRKVYIPLNKDVQGKITIQYTEQGKYGGDLALSKELIIN